MDNESLFASLGNTELSEPVKFISKEILDTIPRVSLMTASLHGNLEELKKLPTEDIYDIENRKRMVKPAKR